MDTVTTLPWSRPLTRADLESVPDDGHRYELLDGTLLVSPAPTRLHQRAVLRVRDALEVARPAHFRVYVAPLDVVLADDTVLQPDVLVERLTDVSARSPQPPPVLVAEVLSPSTRKIDLLLKPARYAAAGVEQYWVVDPTEPSVTAWTLEGGEYVRTDHAAGDDALDLDQPYRVRLVPADLVADR